MRLRELIFQGVLGVEQPTRLRPKGKLARIELPGGVSVDDVHDLLVACLYPKHLNEEHRRRLDFDDTVKIAVVLADTGHGAFRIIRREEPSTVRLQRRKKSGFEDVASGASKVQKILLEKLDLPPLDVFFPLHLWRFDTESIPEPREGAQYGDDPRIPDLIDQYLTALEVESVEDEIKELEARIEEAKGALGKGREIEKKLKKARRKLDEIAVSELSDDDLELLKDKDEKLAKFDDQLARLRDQEDRELDEIHRLLPESPFRNPRFWAGVAVAVLAWVASFIFQDSYRIVAVASIPGLALCGFELLQYFNNMGRAGVHKVRVESIRRRINQVVEEQVLFEDRIDHVLWYAGVESEAELEQRIPQASRLRRGIDKLEKKLETLRNESGYREARDDVDALRERLDVLQQRRQELPDYVMNSFQLENDLESLGVDPGEVVEEAEQNDGPDPTDSDREDASAFDRLRGVAERTGQWNDKGLEARARSTWSKICGHVLSDRFDELDLSSEGELEVRALTDEQLEMWQNTRASEVHAVVAALALALQANISKNGDGFASVWIGDLGDAMTPGHARKFESVFEKAGGDNQIVICEPKS